MRLHSALVPLDCYKEISLSTIINTTGWLINNRKLFLTVMEAGSLKSGYQPDEVRVHFQVADLLLYLHMGVEGIAIFLEPLL